jgi:hypothetical protein
MMFTKKITLLAFVALAALSSCKKDDSTADNKALLTSGKWKLTAETVKGVNTFTTKANCDKDNTWAFTTDGKLTLDEGATKCDPTDPQTETGTWIFTDTEQKKMVITAGFALPVDILELTTTTLKMSIANPFAPTEITVETFSH